MTDQDTYWMHRALELARRLNEGFARWSQHQRPFVFMKVAMTLDGRIAPPAGRSDFAVDSQRHGGGRRQGVRTRVDSGCL
jgi:hypothetical protein